MPLKSCYPFSSVSWMPQGNGCFDVIQFFCLFVLLCFSFFPFIFGMSLELVFIWASQGFCKTDGSLPLRGNNVDIFIHDIWGEFSQFRSKKIGELSFYWAKGAHRNLTLCHRINCNLSGRKTRGGYPVRILQLICALPSVSTSVSCVPSAIILLNGPNEERMHRDALHNPVLLEKVVDDAARPKVQDVIYLMYVNFDYCDKIL